ncbi:MAG: hypothetical protein L0Y66_15230 [Myxococcaceae bacterium]|nr:hypothetical protein [Myxococcaceae bacterium]MCI0670504.1 hypothetical protein [Myxococcaceae bacterium]
MGTRDARGATRGAGENGRAKTRRGHGEERFGQGRDEDRFGPSHGERRFGDVRDEGRSGREEKHSDARGGKGSPGGRGPERPGRA